VATVGSIQVADLLIALGALGADASALRDRAGIAQPQLDDPAARIPAQAVVRAFDLAAAELDDPLVAAHALKHLRPRGPLFYHLLSGPDTRQAVRAYVRFARVALDTLDVRFVERPSHAELTFDPGEPALRASHNVLDFIVAENLAAMRAAIPGFAPLGIDLAHREFGAPGATELAFGCPVRFDRRVSAVRFALTTLESRPLAANRLIALQLEKMSQALLTTVTAATARERVAHAVRQILAAGATPQRTGVARRLHVSERTLQRQLEHEGLTFKEVRDDVRAELSQALLSDRSMKVETVARSLGFAEVASFSKAFARWSGGSPTTYRTSVAARTQTRRTSVRKHQRGVTSPTRRARTR